MHADVRVASVDTTETRSGHTRYAIKDDSGREYTTFRPQIGAAAKAAEGQRARIEFHEQQRGGFTNVYPDKVEPLSEELGGDARAEPEEGGWHGATQAAPAAAGAPQTPAGP